MLDWKTIAKNSIAGRNWSEIRTVWAAAATNFQYGSVDSLESVIDGYVGDDFDRRAASSVFSFPGGTVPGFHDAVESGLRAAYVFGNVQNCLKVGQPTWASIESYHCSMIFCRTLLGLLGIGFVRIKDTNCVIDPFPVGSSKDAQKAFRKQFGVHTEPARLFYRKRGSLIEQSGMWALLVRALRVTSLPASTDAAKEAIVNLEAGFGRSRNDILYRNQPWPYAPDIQWPLSALDIRDDISSYADLTDFFTANRDANFALCRLMIELTLMLMNDIMQDAPSVLLQSYYVQQIKQFSTFAERQTSP